MTVTLTTGVDPVALRRRAFQRADAVASDEPGSVVVATADTGLQGEVADAWAAEYDPLRARVTDLDGLAGEINERVVGPATRLDTQIRRQTIDGALRAVAAETGLPEAHAHEREVRELLSELAAAGYDDPADLGRHVDTHLDDQTAAVLHRVAETAATLREEYAPASYTLPEAYQTLCRAEDPETLVDADVLIVAGYTEFAANQVEFLECLAERTSTEVVVTLPLAATPGRGGGGGGEDGVHADPTAGVNTYVADTHETLVELADEHVEVDEAPSLATAVGRTFTRTPTTDDAVPPGLSWHTAATPIREARATARRVREQLASGASPEDVVVVVPELLSYRDRLTDAFDAVGVPTSNAGRPPLGQTRVGRAALDLVDCCRSTPTARDLATLASNPAVDVGDETGTGLDAGAILSLVERLPTDELDPLRTELDPGSDAAVESLLEGIRRVRDAPRGETIARLRELFEIAGLAIGDDTDEADDTRASIVCSEIDRTLTAVERVADLGDDAASEDDRRETNSKTDESEAPSDPLWRVADALDGRRVAAGGSRPGTVEVVGPQDATGRSYDHLHVIGLTRTAFPPEDRRSRFFARAFDSLPSVDATDRQARARYQFAVLVGTAETATLSHPEVGRDGDDRLPSPITTELARVTGLEPDDSGDDDTESDPSSSIVSSGDLQRALAGHDEQTRETALADAVAAGTVVSSTADGVRSGADCLAGRTADELGPYDAQVEPPTVARLHDPTPFSPTGLRSYAKCGFRHYADRVIELPDEPEYSLEPTPLDRGSLVHDALERFFDELLAETGGGESAAAEDGSTDSAVLAETVALDDYDRDVLERRLLDAVETELERLDVPTGDAFGRRWLETLLAGLATPEANAHYGDDHPHEGVDRGLFVRFLDAERDADDRVLAVESPLDFGRGDPTDADDDATADREATRTIELETTDGRTVSVRGRVDRVAVEVDDGEDGIEIEGRVHDYKTNDPTTKQTFDGVDFQLPVYTVATRRELARRYGDDLASVDGAFYTVEPPRTVRRKRSLLGTIYREGGDWSDFERFLETDLPARVADVSESVADGAFHTTTLDPETAGCDHCRFADVCGVRHHRRRERVDAALADDHYVPEAATPGSYYDTFGGEES